MARVVVIGGGMSGMSFAWHLGQRKPGWEVTVLEAEPRAGGKAWTSREDGFLCERGVNGVLDNKPATLALADALGVPPLRSRDAARKRFVLKRGRLVKLPESPPDFLTSPLLSPLGRLRVLLEPFVPKGDMAKDESLADFARRRLGREAFEQLIDPMATGIYAGNPERLSLKSCFPRIHELEEAHGSLIRAMIRLKKKAAREGKKGPGAGPGGTLTSFEGGMEDLASTLASALGGSLRLACPVDRVYRTGVGWNVVTKAGEEIPATHVVMACPAEASAHILREAAPGVAEVAGRISYPPVSVVCLGVKTEKLGRTPDGFGFLVPGRERRQILGCLWDSAIFPGRAPEGYTLLRILVGGARNPGAARLPDADLEGVVTRELDDVMGLKTRPDFVRVYRWEKAIPQYEVGHGALMHSLSEALKEQPGLHIRCNWVGGVSLNDCVANAQTLAETLASGTAPAGG